MKETTLYDAALEMAKGLYNAGALTKEQLEEFEVLHKKNTKCKKKNRKKSLKPKKKKINKK